MTNVAFQLGKVHALGDVVVLDVNTYDVLLGLPALMALRANLDFERRSIILRNTGGKPYAIPMRLTLRTYVNVASQVSQVMAGTLRVITWENYADDEQSSEDADSSDKDDAAILELARQHICYPAQRVNAKPLNLTDRNLQRTQTMILGEPLVQISRMVDSLEPPRTLYEVELTWTWDSEHRAARENVELLIIQAWRTEVEGDLLGFVFGAVEPGHRQTIMWELTIPFAQLVDDLPLDIISQCDESPMPHVLSRRLTPYLQWSACLEDRTEGDSYPLRAKYLNPRGIIDILFFQPRTAAEEEAVAEEAEVEDESKEETTEEEGSYRSTVRKNRGRRAKKKKKKKIIWKKRKDLSGRLWWVRCPVGICNAPATFQRAMNITFHNFVNKTRLTQGMINFCVIVYMADILVYSKTYHGHTQHIEWTLGALRNAGFKIALKKSEFFLSEISFLGHVVTRGGLRPDSRKVAAVKEALVPTSLTQVRAFLGLASYYRRFIKGFAAIARPLTNLLRKDQPLSWDTECQQAFATLKDALATAPILIRPDPSKQFILITGWQPEAISAILAQKGNDGREHVIEYASRTVPDERRNDSAPQGECYAVVWGIQHFHPYLYEQKFCLLTDHEPLLPLKKLTNYMGMIGHWVVRLQEYDFDIVHQKTERHSNADGLTRLHRPAKWAALRAEEEAEEESEGELRREVGEAAARLAEDEEEEREAEEKSAEAEEEEEEEAEEETSEEEEEAYSEYSEGEQSEEEDEDDEEVESGDDQEPTHDELEWVPRPDRREENPEAAAQRKKEIMEGKRLAIYPASNDPFKDPEPPKPEHGDLAATTSGAATTRRRSRSRSTSPSASARPPIRQPVNEGLSPSSPIHIPPSP
ncbi:hypothetical protein CBR_g12544 [Chara braunii]|uniref:Reverse transcriptase domain-containing protein n=1 Tax=Chara braunii TaxID=69332 RepID=A0A388JSN3_CHABU|nr:hypothetical protein CBR_g12544 [Chara braunii]|eukprot:GBG60806.1 hypothetical protein CBR_g12544 [Chara braunii]